ncbi:uncharacterized protein JCM6883_006193 [Sporobolomyces salmoneus]|uniref:uncharacterized protein n=1 Tax=Sporobolomyces salmoneus TaxID=183962 RepID=UPI0031785F3C
MQLPVQGITPLLVTTFALLSSSLSSSSAVSAAVLPSSSKASNTRLTGADPSSDEWCTPWFSGLVQTVKKTNQAEIVWRAVSTSDTGLMDGVKATNIGQSAIASLEPDLEWFVTPTQDGLFEITSGAEPSYCDPNLLNSPLHALSIDQVSSNCATPHVFSIRCASCDRHSDSARGCLLHSLSRNKCVELSEQGKLKWGECEDLFKKKQGWIGEEERVSHWTTSR